MSKPLIWRPLAGAAATITTAASLVAVVAAPAGAATPAQFTYGGHAYGSSVHLGSLVRSGATAFTPLCTTRAGLVHSDRTAAVNLPGLGTIGAVTAKVTSSRHASRPSTTSTTHTAATTLLAGAIHATAISSTARETKIGSHYRASGGATFLGLTVGGKSIPSTSAQRTIALPGLGKIVLNKRTVSSGAGMHTVTVTALRLTISGNNSMGFPAGSVVVGRAVASIHKPTHHTAYGRAYGTGVNVGNVVRSGRTARVILPCGGSDGVKMTNDTGRVAVPQAVTAAAVTSRARSTDSASRTSATTRARLAGISLLGGVIKIRALTVQANAVRHGAKLSRSSTGTTLLGLVIQGKPMAAPKSATKRAVPGIGTLYFNSAFRSKYGLHVYGLRLVLSQDQGSLKSGAVITVGSASVGIRP